MAPERKKPRVHTPIPSSVEQFKQLGALIMGRSTEGSESVFATRWKSFFCVDPEVVYRTWVLLDVPVHAEGELSHAEPKHLLWALLFLTVYAEESQMAKLVGKEGKAVDEQTFRKWSKIFVERIAFLVSEVVS